MLKKKNLIFICLLLLGVFLINGCLPKPPVTEGILKGQVIVPEGTLQAKDLTGQALPEATVNVIDPATGDIIATTTTDVNGYYQIFVPAGGPYLLQVIKDGIVVLQITPQVEVGIEYDLGTADCSTTAVALIALAMMDAGTDLADINLADIAADPNFGDVLSNVTSIIEAGGDPTESAVIEQAVEDFLSPPAPTPPVVTPTYTVTFDKNDTEATGTMAAQTIDSGSSANLTACAFTKTGWTFAGWATTSGGVIEYADEASYTMGSANVTLYAQWTINTYTVTYDGNGSTGGTIPSDANNYEQGDSVTVLGNTGNLVKTQDGISLLFTGWNTVANGSGTSYNAADTFNMGTANVTLYAEWSAIRATGPAGGLVFYDKGSVSDGWRYLEAAPASTEWSGIEWGSYGTLIGGTGTGTGTGKSNTTTIITWLNSHSETGKAAQICDALTEASYSDWFLPSLGELNLMYANLKCFSVGSFESAYYWGSSEGGDSTAWAKSFDGGFQGKYLKNDFNNRRVRAARAFRSTAPTYIVNYNGNGADGGTVPSDVYHYESGETVTVLDKGTLAKTGYTFTGWNTKTGGGGTGYNKDDTFIMGASNVIIYAQWTINIYTITFDKNDTGATGTMADQTIASGSTANLTACGFTKAGWAFEGWSTTPGGGTVEYNDEASYTMGTANVILYAQWSANNYTITFNKNDTEATGTMADQMIASGSTANLTACEFTKAGWAFEGWATTPGGTVEYNDEASYTMGTANVTLYAKWSYIFAYGPAGGFVFYDKGSYSNGWRYLEAAPSDHSGTHAWSNVINVEVGTFVEIGKGQANTTAIMAQSGHTASAAELCNDLSIVNNSITYDDWFLPSKDELDLMYTNLKVFGVGGFTGYGYYWSSSEYSATSPWGQYFGDGLQVSFSKEYAWEGRVRAIRAY